jgi:hypothetical protein
MSKMPSPVVIIGDTQLGKSTVVKAKKKYTTYHCDTVSATSMSCDEIRMVAGFRQLGSPRKVVLIQEIPNRKAVREFLVDLVKSADDTLRFVIWDSTGQIKIDPKKGMTKTWQDWINELKKVQGFVLVNNGVDFADNDVRGSVAYVQDLFSKRNRQIDNVSAQIFVDLVGKSRSMLSTEVSKLCLIAPKVITKEFVLDNTFPSSKEAVLYKFGNDLDSNRLSKAITSIESFLDSGIDANVLAHIMMNKARWHLAVCHLYSEGVDWNSIKYEIMSMGKFPSIIWHNGQISDSQKKKIAEEFGIPESMEEFMVKKLGIPSAYVNIPIPKTKPKKGVKRGEVIPMPFIGDMIVSYARDKIVAPNRSKYSDAELRRKVLERAQNVYLVISEKLKEIRYNDATRSESLYEMAKVWVRYSL